MSFYDNIGKIKYSDKHSTFDNSQISYANWRKLGELAPIYYPEYYRMEILSPCSKDSYKFAVYNGADAVYFGYKEFNARAGGDNFDSIKEIVDFCHIFGVKAYLALNISFKSDELTKVKEIIIEAENAFIDAFIISDLALLPIIKKLSKAEVHASTQMGAHNHKSVEYLVNLGFDRVVLSREATFEEIQGIKDKKLPIALEIFCHGALCVAFSGACLLSSMLTGCSGNRGRCNQLCRNYYRCFLDGKQVNEGYLLSAKDICAIDSLPKLYEMQVDSLKIEGRLRRSEYVAATAACYSKLKTGDACEKEDYDTLKKLFNRGNFTNGYFDNNDIIYPSIASHIGLKCGKIKKILSKKLVWAETSIPINKDDGFKIIRNNKEVCGAVATGEYKDDGYVLFLDSEACPQINDDVHMTTDTELNKSLLSVRKKLNIEVAVSLMPEENLRVIAHCRDVYVEFGEDKLSLSDGLTIDKNDIIAQFAKTKDTDFELKLVYANIGKIYLSKAALNQLRRKIIEKISDAMLSNYKRSVSKKYLPVKAEEYKIEGDFGEIPNTNMLTEALKEHIKNIVYSPLEFNLELSKAFYNAAKSSESLVFLKPPIFVPHKNLEYLRELIDVFDGVVANNLTTLQIAKDLGKYTVGGYNLNITNDKNLLIKSTNQYIISPELNSKEIRSMPSGLIYGYGHLPLMYLNHCPRKLAKEKCGNCGKKLVYKDAKGEYPITTVKMNGYCQHILKNGILTDIGKELKNFYRYFDFCDSDKEEIENVLYNYKNNIIEANNSCNKLHLSRGVK